MSKVPYSGGSILTRQASLEDLESLIQRGEPQEMIELIENSCIEAIEESADLLEAWPGDPTDLDQMGRPRNLIDRLACLVDLLVCNGVKPMRSMVHALAWFEEGLSSALGAEVTPLAWKTSPHGPFAAAIEDVLTSWDQNEFWKEDPHSPVALKSMEPGDILSVAVTEIFNQLSSGDLENPNTWYAVMKSFLKEMFEARPLEFNGIELLAVSRHRFDRDLRVIFSSMPKYAKLFVPECDDETSLITLGRSQDIDCDFRDKHIEDCKLSAAKSYPEFNQNEFNSKIIFASFVSKAIKAAPLHFVESSSANQSGPDDPKKFGDRIPIAACQKLRAAERKAGGMIHVVFWKGRNVVARAKWKPSRYSLLELYESDEDDTVPMMNMLLDFEVEPKYRRRGIGTCILWYALNRGCVSVKQTVPANDAAKALLSRFCSAPGSDGLWRFHRAYEAFKLWPVCEISPMVTDI